MINWWQISTLLETFGNLRLKHFMENAFDNRDRCWRYYLTFGFTWMSREVDLATVTEKDVTDFEGRWQSRSSKSGSLEVECGKCADCLLWVELSPEKIFRSQKMRKNTSDTYQSLMHSPFHSKTKIFSTSFTDKYAIH